jgi:tetratricopeptide (TPR) repeat protein
LSTRLKILVLVVAAALIAAGTAVGVTLATRQTPAQPQAAEGKPPLGPIIPTPAAKEIRATFKNWPDGGLQTMERLGREYPKDPVVQMYRGLALYWAGYLGDAEAVWEKAKKVGRDTPWAVQVDNLLHPQFQTNYPIFQPSTANPLLEQGQQFQARGQQLSALKLYEQAVRKSPNDCEAQVAAAVARFDKGNLNASFSRLGPLTRKFPQCQTVRYYLGLLLAWTGQRDPAIAQFEKVVAMAPKTEHGREAAKFLASIDEAGGGTGSPTK